MCTTNKLCSLSSLVRFIMLTFLLHLHFSIFVYINIYLYGCMYVHKQNYLCARNYLFWVLWLFHFSHQVLRIVNLFSCVCVYVCAYMCVCNTYAHAKFQLLLYCFVTSSWGTMLSMCSMPQCLSVARSVFSVLILVVYYVLGCIYVPNEKFSRWPHNECTN